MCSSKESLKINTEKKDKNCNSVTASHSTAKILRSSFENYEILEYVYPGASFEMVIARVQELVEKLPTVIMSLFSKEEMMFFWIRIYNI